MLIAEDSEVARDTLAEFIQTLPDIEICGAVEDGAAAVELALKVQPDVVLLDMQMPVMGGIEAAGIFRTCLPHTAIIVMTVRDHPDLRAACLTTENNNGDELRYRLRDVFILTNKGTRVEERASI